MANSDVMLKLNLEEWRTMMNEIMTSYDMVAPFYKISGQDEIVDNEIGVKQEKCLDYARGIVQVRRFVTTVSGQSY